MAIDKKTDNVLKRTINFFSNYYLLRLILLILVGILVWYVGAAISIYNHYLLETAFSRFFLIATISLCYVTYEAYKWYKKKKKYQDLLNSITDAELESDNRASKDLKVLQDRMSAAIEILKKQKLNGVSGNNKSIYELPWYMFIGAPGSGKTTALKNCGLKFPISNKDGILSIKGVGGTRNCDWWFTNDAVFLDTAGRFTTQDADIRADSKAWLGFLEILRKSRSEVPINGAFVTLSLSDILSYDNSELKKYSESVKQRISELYKVLGVKFPIYLLVTKVDLLAGFTQFFSTFGLEERSQIWGFTFPFKNKDQSYIDQFDKEFKLLESNLLTRLVDRTSLEKDTEFRSAIYNFPQQFSSLQPQIRQFIDLVFSSSIFDESPVLRGVYFTSGTQEGTPIDRVLSSLSKSFNIVQKVLPPLNVTGKSFFLRDLLQNLVFLESGLVGYDKNRLIKRNLFFRYSFLFIIFSTVLVSFMLVNSFYSNEKLLKNTNSQIAYSINSLSDFKNSHGNIVKTVKLLNSVRDLPFGHAQENEVPNLLNRFGLSQSDRLGENAKNSYHKLLGQTLLPQFAVLLESQISNPVNDQVLYEALKAYLMLYENKHLDPSTIKAWAYRVLPSTEQELENDLVNHLKASTTRQPIFIEHPKNILLIDNARERLKSVSLAVRVFGRLKLVSDTGDIRPFTITSAAGPAASQVFELASGRNLDTPISAIFTRDGYNKSIKPVSESLVKQLSVEEEWVLGKNASDQIDPITLKNSTQEVKRIYFTEYIKTWDDLLLDIRVKKSSSLSETILQSRVLSSSDSTLKKLIYAIKKETKLLDDNKATSDKTNLVDIVKNATEKIVASASRNQISPSEESMDAEKLVDDHFARLHQLVDGESGQPVPLDQSISLLNEFSKELADLESKIFTGSATIQGLPTAIRLKAEAEISPPPVQNILNSLVSSSNNLASAANQQVIKKGASGAADLCKKAINGRYPFSKNGKTEVDYDDFNTVFRPGGDLDSFFKTNLGNLVDTSAASWKMKEGSEKVAFVSPSMVRNFEKAEIIRQAFFKGSPFAGFSADMVLTNPEVGEYSLEYDGEVYKIGNAETKAIKLRWPGQRPAQPTRLFAGWGKENVKTEGYEGTWSLFRLLDQASRSSNSRNKVTFDVENSKLNFEIKVNSAFNPLSLRELQTFSCPG